MLKNILNTYFLNKVENFDQQVLTAIPLRGMWDPEKPTGASKDTSISGSGISSEPPPPTTPYVPSARTKRTDYILRSGKKPNVFIPLPDPTTPNTNLEFSQQFGLPKMGPDGSQIGTYDDIQYIELQKAFDTCARYDDCWGITIVNGDYAMSAEDVALSGLQTYTYKLIKKPTNGDLENLACDAKSYTYLKLVYAYANEPSVCKTPTNQGNGNVPRPNPNKITSAPSKNNATVPDYYNAPPDAIKPSIISNPLVIGAIVCVVMVLLITIGYIATMKTPSRRR